MAKKSNLLKGNHPDIVNSNIKTLKDAGYEHNRAVRCALCHANKKHDKHAKKVASKVVKSMNSDQVSVKVSGGFNA